MLSVLVLLAVALGFAGGVGWASVGAKRADRRDALNRRERKELSMARKATDEIFQAALDRVEVDPFAVVAIDIVRKYQRGISE